MTGAGQPPGASSDGATPLDADEAADLIPTHLATRDELNEWEQANISGAQEWLRGRRGPVLPLDVGFLQELHRRMFDKTWRWAGRFRTTGKNIGVAPHDIPEQLAVLLGNVAFWLEHRTFPLDEIAVRYHHGLVHIHPFVNGNGRHGRLATDLLLESRGARPFSWGSGDLDHRGDPRDRYLKALRRADGGDFAELHSFARS